MAKSGARKKKVIFSLILLGLLLVVMELMARVGVTVLDRKLGLQAVDLSSMTATSSRRAGGPRLRFDADLGWDTIAAVRQGGAARQGKAAFAAAYGDSFTYCDEVTEKQSWQRQFQELTGETILNLGVNGYGTDQAYLKLEKYHEHYPSRVLILGLMADDIGRNGSVVANFYLRTPRLSVKPRYAFVADGSLRLRPSPARSAAALAALASVEALEPVARDDYWYQVRLQRYGFDMLRGRGLPYLLHLAVMVRGMAQYGAAPMDRYYFLRNPGSEPMRITRRLLARFRDRAQDSGARPVVMLHHDDRDMTQHHLLESLARHIIKELGMPLFDVREVLQEALNRGTVRRKAGLFMPGHHYSPEANGVIAKGLRQFFKTQKLLNP